ncbi:hypothetical protein HPP92_016222 [Vanilla planifolia]|uniref:Pectinesterase inhibitor domain-containing protein n=1 Tax=Vanilla planifolia TaxID=51239 RepID=A0A835UPS5_VANPL|nr:hypothetical protein HPP92_016222 [Vanilla planifolia]
MAALLFALPVLLLHLFVLAAGAATPSSLVLASCAHSRYPNLCIHTLASSAARTPTDLAVDSIFAAASSARNVTSFLHHLSPPPFPAVRDCVEQIADSGGQLSSAAAELRKLRPENSQWTLDNAQTWVSAALTNEDTCLDAIRRLPAGVHRSVSAHVSEARRVTCNALYLVAHLAGGSPHRR